MSWWVESGIEGSTFEIPDADTSDTTRTDSISQEELAEFYRRFQERFGVAFLDASYKVFLLTNQKKALHIRVQRKDEFTYVFTVNARRFQP